jgi:hypothetical protein
MRSTGRPQVEIWYIVNSILAELCFMTEQCAMKALVMYSHPLANVKIIIIL